MQQLQSRHVGFLLGAGSSYLGGKGYPLANSMWPAIRSHLVPRDQETIQKELEKAHQGLEDVLDALDDGREPFGLRDRVADAVAACFREVDPALDHHRPFVRGISRRHERRIPVFTLNYDPLVELGADKEELLHCDGFLGGANCFFDPKSFDYQLGFPERRKGKVISEPLRGVINLFKLHGSLGWHLDSAGVVRRGDPGQKITSASRPLMIPPGHRKGRATLDPPYSTLWSNFYGLLNRDRPGLLSRLVCVGYGFRDGHVNAVLESASRRTHFTLIILARTLEIAQFDKWKKHSNAIVVTKDRCSFYGEEGPGHKDMWSFEWLAQAVESYS